MTRYTYHGISIHAPAWGATRLQTVCQDQTGDFNPRARVGRDDVGARPRRAASHFNPRARVGRDKVKPMVIDREQDFNPRARVGRDFRPDRRPEAIEISIHAPAWGATGAGFSPSSTRTNFNPRARVGRDDGSCLQDRQHLISIHAPAWGATSGRSHSLKQSLISIHAPAWGAT